MTLILHLFLGTLLVWRPWWGLGCRRAALWLELAIFVSLDLTPHLQEEPSCAPACLALLPGPVPSRQVSAHTDLPFPCFCTPFRCSDHLSFRLSAP